MNGKIGFVAVRLLVVSFVSKLYVFSNGPNTDLAYFSPSEFTPN